MSDLTPAQRIEAAIVRLEKLKANSTLGPWSIDEIPETGECRIIRDFEFFGPQHEVVTGGGSHKIDAALIVTLHATIDAQLDWLSDQSARMKAEVGTIGTPEVHYRHALALADAIISGGTE